MSFPLEFSLDPLSRKEAWLWLIENACNNQINISIRLLATHFKWDKSKVERFIQLLKSNEMIKTEIKTKKLQIIICNFGKTSDTVTKNETVLETKTGQDSHDNLQKDYKKDNCKTAIDIENKGLNAIYEANHQTKTGQNLQDNQEQDNFKTGETQEIQDLQHSQTELERQNQDEKLKKKKKEKNQKKDKDLIKKEKYIPYGDIKKEKNSSLSFDSATHEDYYEFASSLGFSNSEVSWEFNKFKDHWLGVKNKPPKNIAAAFRNWLRKSLEFRRNYHEPSKNTNSHSNTKSSFERFLAAGARAIAKRQGNRLDEESNWQEHQIYEECTSDIKKFRDV
jgi:hypothetical protein